MKNEKYWNGFIVGLFIGGTIGIIVMNLIQMGLI